MSKKSRRKERKTKRLARRMTYSLAKPSAEERNAISDNCDKCLFCGARDSLQRHHIIQKRFHGSDNTSNIVLLCPRCHRLYHGLTDLLLDHVLKHRKINYHEIRETVTPETPTVKVDTEKGDTKRCVHIDISF